MTSPLPRLANNTPNYQSILAMTSWKNNGSLLGVAKNKRKVVRMGEAMVVGTDLGTNAVTRCLRTTKRG